MKIINYNPEFGVIPCRLISERIIELVRPKKYLLPAELGKMNKDVKQVFAMNFAASTSSFISSSNINDKKELTTLLSFRYELFSPTDTHCRALAKEVSRTFDSCPELTNYRPVLSEDVIKRALTALYRNLDTDCADFFNVPVTEIKIYGFDRLVTCLITAVNQVYPSAKLHKLRAELMNQDPLPGKNQLDLGLPTHVWNELLKSEDIADALYAALNKKKAA